MGVEELRVLRPDDDVGVAHEVQSAAAADAVHRADDGLVHLLHQPGDREPHVTHGAGPRLLDVDAGAEELLTRRREDRDPHVVVVPEVGPDRLHLIAHLDVERVAGMCPVQRDVRDPILLLVDRFGEGQSPQVLDRHRCPRLSRSDRRETAVDVDRLHGDRAGSVRGQEQHQRHDLFRIDEAAHRDLGDPERPRLFRRLAGVAGELAHAVLDHVGEHEARDRSR